MGSHDGRNAHLVEQVTTKSRVVFLSAWASEPTLSQAFVPWFFTCAPNDLQQADAFINEIYVKRKISNLIVVSDNEYDSGSALKNFLKKNQEAGKNTPLRFEYENNNDLISIADNINKAKGEAIILFGNPAQSLELIRLLKKLNCSKIIFGSLSLLSSDQDLKSYENAVLVSPVEWSDRIASVFHDEYNKMFGLSPGAVSAYAYDGMSLIIDAIKHAGTERENIQKYLANVKFAGVTGEIQFDEKGKRIGTPELIQIRKDNRVMP
jgi:branched-chain amino acid transport system substrate-binding protein